MPRIEGIAGNSYAIIFDDVVQANGLHSITAEEFAIHLEKLNQEGEKLVADGVEYSVSYRQKDDGSKEVIIKQDGNEVGSFKFARNTDNPNQITTISDQDITDHASVNRLVIDACIVECTRLRDELRQMEEEAARQQEQLREIFDRFTDQESRYYKSDDNQFYRVKKNGNIVAVSKLGADGFSEEQTLQLDDSGSYKLSDETILDSFKLCFDRARLSDPKTRKLDKLQEEGSYLRHGQTAYCRIGGEISKITYQANSPLIAERTNISLTELFAEFAGIEDGNLPTDPVGLQDQITGFPGYDDIRPALTVENISEIVAAQQALTKRQEDLGSVYATLSNPGSIAHHIAYNGGNYLVTQTPAPVTLNIVDENFQLVPQGSLTKNAQGVYVVGIEADVSLDREIALAIFSTESEPQSWNQDRLKAIDAVRGAEKGKLYRSGDVGYYATDEGRIFKVQYDAVAHSHRDPAEVSIFADSADDFVNIFSGTNTKSFAAISDELGQALTDAGIAHNEQASANIADALARQNLVAEIIGNFRDIKDGFKRKFVNAHFADGQTQQFGVAPNQGTVTQTNNVDTTATWTISVGANYYQIQFAANGAIQSFQISDNQAGPFANIRVEKCGDSFANLIRIQSQIKTNAERFEGVWDLMPKAADTLVVRNEDDVVSYYQARDAAAGKFIFEYSYDAANGWVENKIRAADAAITADPDVRGRFNNFVNNFAAYQENNPAFPQIQLNEIRQQIFALVEQDPRVVRKNLKSATTGRLTENYQSVGGKWYKYDGQSLEKIRDTEDGPSRAPSVLDLVTEFNTIKNGQIKLGVSGVLDTETKEVLIGKIKGTGKTEIEAIQIANKFLGFDVIVGGEGTVAAPYVFRGADKDKIQGFGSPVPDHLKEFARANFAAFASSTIPALKNAAGVFCELGINEDPAPANIDNAAVLRYYQEAMNGGCPAAFDAVIRCYKGGVGCDQNDQAIKNRVAVLESLSRVLARPNGTIDVDGTAVKVELVNGGVKVTKGVAAPFIIEADLTGYAANQAVITELQTALLQEDVDRDGRGRVTITVPSDLRDSEVLTKFQQVGSSVEVDGESYCVSKVDETHYDIQLLGAAAPTIVYQVRFKDGAIKVTKRDGNNPVNPTVADTIKFNKIYKSLSSSRDYGWTSKQVQDSLRQKIEGILVEDGPVDFSVSNQPCKITRIADVDGANTWTFNIDATQYQLRKNAAGNQIELWIPDVLPNWKACDDPQLFFTAASTLKSFKGYVQTLADIIAEMPLDTRVEIGNEYFLVTKDVANNRTLTKYTHANGVLTPPVAGVVIDLATDAKTAKDAIAKLRVPYIDRNKTGVVETSAADLATEVKNLIKLDHDRTRNAKSDYTLGGVRYVLSGMISLSKVLQKDGVALGMAGLIAESSVLKKRQIERGVNPDITGGVITQEQKTVLIAAVESYLPAVEKIRAARIVNDFLGFDKDLSAGITKETVSEILSGSNAQVAKDLKDFAIGRYEDFDAANNKFLRNLAGIFCELGIHEAPAAGAAVAAPNLVQALVHYQFAANAGSLAAMDSVFRFYENRIGIDPALVGDDRTDIENEFSQRAKVLKALKWAAENNQNVEYDATLGGYKVLSPDGASLIAVVKSNEVFGSDSATVLDDGFNNTGLIERVTELEALQNVKKGYVATPSQLSESLLRAAFKKLADVSLKIDGVEYTCSFDAKSERYEIIAPDKESGYRVTFGADKIPQVEKVIKKTGGRFAIGPSDFKAVTPEAKDHIKFASMIREARTNMDKDGGLIAEEKKKIIKAINGNDDHDALDHAGSKTAGLIDKVKGKLETRFPNTVLGYEAKRKEEAERIVENLLGLSGYFVDPKGKVNFHSSDIVSVNKEILDIVSDFAAQNYRGFVAKKDVQADGSDQMPNDHLRLLGCNFAQFYNLPDRSREANARNLEVLELMATRADDPNPIAQSLLAEIYSQQGKITEARALFGEATKAGYAKAYLGLGDSYSGNSLTLGSVTSAYEAGANLGDARSIFETGMRYLEYNTYVPTYDNQNHKKAFEYFKKGDALGHRPSIMQLAKCYENGTGVVKNEARAFELYKKAVVDLGYEDGILDLVRCYRKDVVSPQNVYMANALEMMYYALQTKAEIGGYQVVGYDRDAGFRIKQGLAETTVKIDYPGFLRDSGVSAIKGSNVEIDRINARRAINSSTITLETRGIVRFPTEFLNNPDVCKFAADNKIEFVSGDKTYRVFKEADKPFLMRQVDQDGNQIAAEVYYRIDVAAGKVFKEKATSIGGMGTNADVSDDALVAKFFAQVAKLKTAPVRDVIDYRFLNSLGLVVNNAGAENDDSVSADFSVGDEKYRITKVAAYDHTDKVTNPSDIYEISYLTDPSNNDKKYHIVIPGDATLPVEVKDHNGNAADRDKVLQVRALINGRGIDKAEKVNKAEVEYDNVVAAMDADVEYKYVPTGLLDNAENTIYFVKSPAKPDAKPTLHQYKRDANGLMSDYCIPNAANAANAADRVEKMAAVAEIDFAAIKLSGNTTDNAGLHQIAIIEAPKKNVKTTDNGVEGLEDISLLVMQKRADEMEGKPSAEIREIQSRFPVRNIDGVERYTFSVNGHDYCVVGDFVQQGTRTSPHVVTAGVISRIERKENPRMLGSYSPFSQTFSDTAEPVTDAFELVQLQNEFIRFTQQQQSKTALEDLVGQIKRVPVVAADPLADEKARKIVDGFFGISNDRQGAMGLIATFNPALGGPNPVKVLLDRFCADCDAEPNKTSFDISFAASHKQNYPADNPDKVAAVQGFLTAANLGNAHAQNNLGHIYETKEDFIIASYAVGFGDIAAGTVAPTKEERERQAFEYYCAAARQGDLAGLENVARCYRDGIGVDTTKNEENVKIADTLTALIENSQHQPDAGIAHEVLQYHPQKGFVIKDKSGKEVSRVRIGEAGQVVAKRVVNGEESDFPISGQKAGIGSQGFSTIMTAITGDEEAKRVRSLVAQGKVDAISNSLRDAIVSAVPTVLLEDAERIAKLFCNIPDRNTGETNKPKQDLLGSLPKEEQDVVRAFAYRYVADFARSKNPQLQDLAGQIYFNGIGVKKDYAKARACFESAAGAEYINRADRSEISFKPEGYKMAQYHLGMMYLCGGSNLAKDDRNAFRCFENAAGDAGSPKFAPAIPTLASCYLLGIGCEVDVDEANRLYNSTAPGVNLTTAVSHVKQQLRSGNLVDRGALEILVRMADKQPECYTEIGSLYEKGADIATLTGSGPAAVVRLGPNTNPSLAAAEQYRKGIEAGSTSSMRAMASLHIAGKAVKGTTDQNSNYAKSLTRQASIFEACAISLGIEDNTITVPNGRFSKASNYKVSKSGDGYVISIDGREQDGFKIKGNGAVYVLKKGTAELQENRKPADGKEGTGLEDELLTKILRQMVADNERALARNSTGLEEKALLGLVEKLSKIKGMDKFEAEYIARDFFGLASHQKRISSVAQNGGGIVIDNYYGNNHRQIGGQVKEVLTNFAASNTCFKDSPSAHLRNMYGVFCEMGLISGKGNAEAQTSYQSAASMGYTPAQYNLANLLRLENTSTTASIDEALPLMAALAQKKYFPAVKAYAEIIIADADPDREAAKKSSVVRDHEVVEAARATKALAWAKQSENTLITIKSGQKDVLYQITEYDREKGFVVERMNGDGTLSKEGFRVGALHEANPRNYRFSATGEVPQSLIDRAAMLPVAIESDLSKIIEKLEEKMRAQDTAISRLSGLRPNTTCTAAVGRAFGFGSRGVTVAAH